MTVHYEDNFGFSAIDCPEERAFLEYVKSQSVDTICPRCNRLIRLIPNARMCAQRPPLAWPLKEGVDDYAALTVIVFADFCASALFGRVTVSRPLEKQASIFASSTS